MVATLPASDRRTRQKLAVIDCDIHAALPSMAVLDQFLPERWRAHRQVYGVRGFAGGVYPRWSQNAARTDSWPPNGGPPGSDLPFLRQQLLDDWDIEIGVLTPLGDYNRQPNVAYSAALARAWNEWQLHDWLDLEPRLRASIVVPVEGGELAAAEIDHWAKRDSRFIQSLILVRTSEPLGHPKYWPMYEASVRNDLPIGIHFGGNGGNPLSSAGYPSFYIEDHVGNSQSFQAQIASLVLSGVFERFPTLRIVLIEGGFAWLPTLAWRLDRHWERLRDEVPEVKRPPSEYIRRNLYLTTQPMEEPNNLDHFHDLLEQLDMPDHIFFATDYPHWDFDAPDSALPVRLSDDLTRKILAENARAFYRL